MREKKPTEINYLLTRQELESFTIQIQTLPRTLSIVKWISEDLYGEFFFLQRIFI